jgi:hypothetical protein
MELTKMAVTEGEAARIKNTREGRIETLIREGRETRCSLGF